MAYHFTRDALTTLLTPSFTLAASKTITGVAAAGNVVTVTSNAHGFSTGDWLVQTEVAGAVEANGLFSVTKVDANSYTVDGLTAVTNYTSGGKAKKVSIATLVKDLKPYQLQGLLDSLSRVPHVRSQDHAAGATESTLGVTLASVTP